MAESQSFDASRLSELGAGLADLLRLRTLPVALKLYEDPAALDDIERLRRPPDSRWHTTCQLVTQARWAGVTLGIVKDNVMPGSNCGGVIGLDTPSEDHLSGRQMTGVWFENQKAAKAHQDGMPRVPTGKYKALVVSPLRAARLDDPDTVLFYGTPGQMILFINGLQWKNYKRYDFSITGESACADSWGRALKTGETCLSLPCFAERRYGGVADDEMAMALPPAELARAVEGLQGLSKAGLRYPVLPYGPSADPAEGLNVSYAKK